MSVAVKNGSSGTEQIPGGDPASNQNDPQNPNPKPETVKYETYSKVLSEKKKRDEENEALKTRVAEFEAKELERQEAEAKAKGDFETQLKLEREKNAKLEQSHKSLQTTVVNGQKRAAFLGMVNGDVDEAFWSLIPLDSIALDKSTGMPDEASVKKAVELFETKYARVIVKDSGVTLPNEAARGGSTTLSYDQWMQLPDEQKAERMKDVDKKTL